MDVSIFCARQSLPFLCLLCFSCSPFCQVKQRRRIKGCLLFFICLILFSLKLSYFLSTSYLYLLIVVVATVASWSLSSWNEASYHTVCIIVFKQKPQLISLVGGLIRPLNAIKSWLVLQSCQWLQLELISVLIMSFN